MRLRSLLGTLPRKLVSTNLATLPAHAEVDSISFDSRTVRPGSLFVAIRGWEQDGHRFIRDALHRGASAVVAEEPFTPGSEPSASDVPFILTPDSRKALAWLAAAFFRFPGREMRVVGVTGTDGKTTTTNLIYAMLSAAGLPTGMLSTISGQLGGRVVDTGLHTTTPSPLEVQQYLRAMLDAGITHAVLETTSHALDQERTLGSEFDVAVVTNVTSEHLDYHGTYARYLATKGRLFDSLAGSYRKTAVPKISITNADDISYGYLRQFPADRHLTYGILSEADIMARAIEMRPEGVRFRAITPRGALEVASPLLGRYNVYNILAAATVAIALDVPNEAIALGASHVGALSGRWERVATGEGFSVVIDFAHTPYALEEALKLARSQATGRVIVVFGCAGLRDRFKRPIMGEIAGRLADVIVLTAEDPRTERVDAIIEQIADGCRRAGRVLGTDYFSVPDRAAAVESAVAMAKEGDLVLVTGKGHERSLCIGDTEHPWSEHDAVKKALDRRRMLRRDRDGEGIDV